MFKRMLVAVFALFAVSTASHAGRTEPIYDINDAAIATGTGETPSLAAVEKVFFAAARIKGWRPTRVGEGHYVVSIDVRQHFAEIDVRLTPETYSINYKNSRVLRYDGTKIHRNYNKWVKLLEQEFLVRLTAL